MTQGKANNVEEFLGIDINSFNKTGKRAFIITQDNLINNIIKTCGIYDCNTNTKPTAIQDTLGTDTKVNTDQYQDQCKYASVIVILIYVSSNFTSKIDFAVHQCVRLTHNFNQSN